MSTRRLAAIMFTDIAGYTALMQTDEPRAIALRQRHREVFERQHAAYRGQIVQYYGDGTLSVFDSAVDAVSCAVAMQREFQQAPHVPLRIGLHTGDILITETEVIGDGVNLASRVESMAVPGAVLVSESVFDQIKNQPEFEGKSLGMFTFKNVTKPIEVFAIVSEGLEVPNPKSLSGKFLKRTSATGNPLQRLPIWVRYVGGLALFLLLAPIVYAPVLNLFQANAATDRVSFVNAAGETVTRELIPAEQRREVYLGAFEVAPDDTDLAWASLGLPHAVEVDFDQDPYCSIRSDKQQLLTTLSEQLKAANQKGAQYLLRGSVRRTEAGFASALELYDLPGGTLRDRFTAQASAMLDLADSITVMTKQRLDLPAGHLAAQPDLPLREVLTRSPEAYAAFAQGLHAILQNSPAFFDLMQRALELDSTFAYAAYSYANFLNIYQRSPEQTRRTLDLAIAHMGRMPDLYSVYVRQLNYKVKGQSEKALELLKLMTQLEPSETDHWEMLSAEAFLQGEYETSLEAIRQIRKLQDDPSYLLKNEAQQLHRLGRAEEGLRAIEAHLRKQADDRAGLLLKGQLLLALDKIDEAEQVFQQGTLLFDDYPFFEQMVAHCAFRRDHSLLTAETAAAYVGTYWVDFLTQFRFQLTFIHDHLAFQAPNQPKLLFYQTSDSTFTSVHGFSIDIMGRKNDRVNRLKLLQHQRSTLLASRLEPTVAALFEAFEAENMTRADSLIGLAREAAPEDSFLVMMADHLAFRQTPAYQAELTQLDRYVGEYPNAQQSFYFLLQNDRLYFNQGVSRQGSGLDPARLFAFAPGKFITTGTKVTYFDFEPDGSQMAIHYYEMGRTLEAPKKAE